jgi:hypothetical protein
MAQFNSMPAELICQVAEYVIDHRATLASLARCNRRCRDLVTPLLLKRHYGTAATWVADHGDLRLLKTVLPHMLRNSPVAPSVESSSAHDPILGDLLHRACAAGHRQIAGCLIRNGADISAKSKSSSLCTCFHPSAYMGGLYSPHLICPSYSFQPLHSAICKWVFLPPWLSTRWIFMLIL